jgi:uncharacterized protein (DUF2252 family)
MSRDERRARGKAARSEAPLESLALFAPTQLRPDPVQLLERQAAERVPDLVPIRYGRMLSSEFAFLRGAALVMASDLASTPASGLRAQLCGDAHLSNFGVFASPERRLVFDVNDFDETLPGPFEWDVKRLAASLEVAALENGYRERARRSIVLASSRSYREAMRGFAAQTNLAVWYANLDVGAVFADLRGQLKPVARRRTEAELAKARTKDSLQAFAKLTRVVDGHRVILSDPPLLVAVEELLPPGESEQFYRQLNVLVRSYLRTLQSDRRHLLSQYRLLHVARKVVGVGSVGTRCWILLFEGIDDQDPIFLQAKEAQASVLEEYAGVSEYRNHGQRVVSGQRLMQAFSDTLLGWQRANGLDGVGRDYYLRQLRDWKASVSVERMTPAGMETYGRLCGWTLARAHACSGDRVAIASYLGAKDTFDRAMADFARAYAAQNSQDYRALAGAVDEGRLSAHVGV